MFRKSFSIEGRINRTEYILSFIISLIAIISSFEITDMVVRTLLVFALLWFMLAQGAKRCHDRGNSAYFQFIPFYIFWMLLAKGDTKTNKYGPISG